LAPSPAFAASKIDLTISLLLRYFIFYFQVIRLEPSIYERPNLILKIMSISITRYYLVILSIVII
ncbi:MAG TPA: hypothetical protein VFI73_01735, partial [Candidatus Nitrosopolaris sp.]|nr:hypothetical protein [Candidatus Nitrosopolaris sp.]